MATGDCALQTAPVGAPCAGRWLLCPQSVTCFGRPSLQHPFLRESHMLTTHLVKVGSPAATYLKGVPGHVKLWRDKGTLRVIWEGTEKASDHTPHMKRKPTNEEAATRALWTRSPQPGSVLPARPLVPESLRKQQVKKGKCGKVGPQRRERGLSASRERVSGRLGRTRALSLAQGGCGNPQWAGRWSPARAMSLTTGPAGPSPGSRPWRQDPH